MTNTIKRFDYRIDKGEPGDILPKEPTVTIELNFGNIRGPSGFPDVTSNLVESEIDWEIAALKADLDAVGARAKAAIRRARANASE